MNTVIVPVDFSETSLNAANYAAQLLSGHDGVKLILYHFSGREGDDTWAGEELERLREELWKKGIVEIVTLAEYGHDFIDELEKLARHQEADLIIMGIRGKSAVQQAPIGSNTLKMVERKVCPVLIVHSDTQYREITNVMLASDLKNVVNVTPSVPIKKVLKTFHPNLHIVNVNSEHYIAISETYEEEKERLGEMFAEFNPEFYFLNLFDVEDALSLFAEEKNIDLIISIQRDHSLLHRLFKSSHTKNLAYHSTIPVYAVHE